MSKALNYTSIPWEIKEAIETDLKKAGEFELVIVSKYSQNEGDKHLWLVMGKGGYRNGYTTWLYNTSVGDGLCERHGDMDFRDALMDFESRLRD